ncbi:DMT family transporter, partial [Bordetella petrii]|uniref:DMT family transporter n=1 Tax=Bordetella petrii TaxID=94624 RepID=UPI001E2A437F
MPAFHLASFRSRFAALPLLALEAALVVAWSSGFVGARFAVDHAPVFLVVFWRCVLVCLLLLPWAWKELRGASARTWARHAGIGLLAMAGYLAGVVKGVEQGVPTALAALIADLLPLGTAMLASVFLRQPAGLRVWAGLLVGLAGVLLVSRGALGAGAAPWWAYALPVLGMLSLAVATLWQGGGTARRPGLSLVANLWLQCAVSGLVFAALAALEGGLIPPATLGFGVSVAWTAVLSSLGGYGLYWICLRRTSPTRVASVLYLSPGVTAVWAWAMFAEPLSWLMALGMGVSVAGIMLVVRGERRPCAAQARRRAKAGAG